MGHRTLKQTVDDLASQGRLIRIADEVDPHLEAAEIHRRVYQSGGPALLFENVKGCQYPMVSNLFGTLERARFIFRDTYDAVRRLIELKIDPNAFWSRPGRYWKTPVTALGMLPRATRGGAALASETTISRLPHVTS
ncbi:MAG: UbiD family decarboxylase, partial [Pirellulaceae bacterium]|nr:UbiD family decarboxylase [Pirellulaceae bacterium]